jgi:hypothetical protein
MSIWMKTVTSSITKEQSMGHVWSYFKIPNWFPEDQKYFAQMLQTKRKRTIFLVYFLLLRLTAFEIITSLKAYCLLYVPPGLTFSNSTFCPHSVFMCFVWIWEQTAIISLYSINWLVCITEV